jgi:hypothetical protein
MSSSLNWKSVAFSHSADVVVVAMALPVGAGPSPSIKSVLIDGQQRHPPSRYYSGGAGTLGKSS